MRALAALLFLLQLPACGKDACEGLPAQAQIEVSLVGISRVEVKSVEVTLTVNGAPMLTRRFSSPPSFVFELKELDRPPRALRIQVTARNLGGQVVGAGELLATLSGDACNFLSVTVKPLAPTEAGRPDAAVTDGRATDTALDPSKPDAPKLDAPKPDAPKPDAPKPDAPKPDAPKPDALKPDAPKPDAPKPDTAKPDAAKPDAAKPDATKPDAAKPDATKPDTAKPDAAKPDTAKPDAAKLDTAKPDAAKPDTLKPDAAVCSKWVSTLAGTATGGFADGPLAVALFRSPAGVAFDAAGKLHVADQSNNRIRLISGGLVSTLAGDGTGGFLDGPVASARFQDPESLAFDSSGKLYVADVGNHRIRAITGGQVSTFAGSGAGFQDGPAATAKFNLPYAVAVDGAGKVYVADAENHRVRLIAGGQVSTLAGDGTTGFLDGAAAGARFYYPLGIAVDGGKVYVADSWNNRIRVIENGQVSTLAGDGTQGYADGPAASAKVNRPIGIRAAGGMIYIADTGNHRIRLVQVGQVSTLAGDGTKGFADGPATSARFAGPHDVAVDTAGLVYVADDQNNRIRVVCP
jgi:DNA-binding beta-propeller fold protein YncE